MAVRAGTRPIGWHGAHMATGLTSSEESQLTQTIEMFEVITQSQPQDYQSLEILKEAYFKLGRESEVITTSKRIAQAYVMEGQLSSAILEYESILQRCPDDPEVLAALGEIESKAMGLAAGSPVETAEPGEAPSADAASPEQRGVPRADVEDGRPEMRRLFVEGNVIAQEDFDLCWPTAEALSTPGQVVEPFVQRLAEKNILSVDKSLRLLSDRSRLAYLPLHRYEPDLDLTRTFPAETCQRWCVLPFDRLSKSILVATVNPFNRQAAIELERATRQRLLWYLAPPLEIVKAVRRAFR